VEVKIFNLGREYCEIKISLLELFDEVCSGGEFILGKNVVAFEAEFARYLGIEFVAGVGSGTDALRLGGLALGLKQGDKIITTANTYIATVMALSVHGIIPVLCDIEPETYNMDPVALEEMLKREKKVKACIPVHLYGHPCHMEKILEVCGRYGVKVFEDACQSHGARYKGRSVGTFGVASAFSFYPTKNLGAYGDAGAVTTTDRTVYDEICKLRNYGQKEKHAHLLEGFNSRLDELQAAILRFKLTRLDADIESRRAIADIYRLELQQGSPVGIPVEKPWARHAYHLYVIRTKDRESLRDHLNRHGIGTLVHYPTPIHLQAAYQKLGYKEGAFRETESAVREILSLPIYPGLKRDEVMYICKTIKDFYAR